MADYEKIYDINEVLYIYISSCGDSMLVVTEDHSNYQKLLLIDHISQGMWSNSLYKTWVVIKRKLNGWVLGPLVHGDFISVALSLFFIACLPFRLYSSSLQCCPPLTGSCSVFQQNLSFSFLYHQQFVAMLHGTSFVPIL